MKKTVLFLLTLALLLCAGCQPKQPDPQPPASSSHLTPEVPPEPEDPFAAYPNGLKGLTLYSGAEADLGNGLRHLATIDADAQSANGYFRLSQLYNLGGTLTAASYTLSDQQLYEGEGDYQDPAEANTTYHLAILDPETLAVRSSRDFSESADFCETTLLDDEMWTWNYRYTGEAEDLEVIGYNVTTYNKDYERTASFQTDHDTYGYLSELDGYYYYCRNNALYRIKLNSGEPEEQISVGGFAVSMLHGLYHGSDGRLCAVVSGRAGDLREYRGLADLTNGKMLRFEDPSGNSPFYFYPEHNALIARNYGEEPQNCCFLVTAGGEAFRYSWTQDCYMNLYSLGHNKLLFYAEDSEGEVEISEDQTHATIPYTYQFWLYDGATGKLEGMTTVKLSGNYCWLYGAPLYNYATDEVVFTFQHNDGQRDYISWSPDQSAVEGSELQPLTVKEGDFRDLLTVDPKKVPTDWDPTIFTPGPCEPELAEQRKRADELGEQLGLTIRIGSECRNVLGGYAVIALTDPDSISVALDELEYEASKYPEGFLKQMKWGGIHGIEVHIASTIIGTTNDGLSAAGGFKTIEGDRVVLVMDCSYPGSIRSTFHHELSHAIDSKLQFEYDRHLLDDEDWIALSPEDCYTYNYHQFGKPEFTSYIYSWDSLDRAYFIDDYSMTFPTEDRARLFENIMVDRQNQWVSWDKCPHLREKLNCYASAIRKDFDTTGWKNVPWEIYWNGGDTATN